TRLQVEHPVTEKITSLDLVEWQIKIAADESLPLKQDEINAHGHAIECRVYAEDPNTFFPSPGKINTLELAKDIARYDFGVEQGTDVSPFYDPMIRKIIVHGEDRNQAIAKAKAAIDATKIEGIKTNLPLQASIMDDDVFKSGN